MIADHSRNSIMLRDRERERAAIADWMQRAWVAEKRAKDFGWRLLGALLSHCYRVVNQILCGVQILALLSHYLDGVT
jgi:hypothetical protein